VILGPAGIPYQTGQSSSQQQPDEAGYADAPASDGAQAGGSFDEEEEDQQEEGDGAETGDAV
jgi:hypothetical protein